MRRRAQRERRRGEAEADVIVGADEGAHHQKTLGEQAAAGPGRRNGRERMRTSSRKSARLGTKAALARQREHEDRARRAAESAPIAATATRQPPVIGEKARRSAVRPCRRASSRRYKAPSRSRAKAARSRRRDRPSPPPAGPTARGPSSARSASRARPIGAGAQSSVASAEARERGDHDALAPEHLRGEAGEDQRRPWRASTPRRARLEAAAGDRSNSRARFGSSGCTL